MNILLISVNKEHNPYPVAPLGLAYISSALRSHGHKVELIDLCFLHDPEEVLKTRIHYFKPQCIGLSIRNIDNLTYRKSIFYIPDVKKVVLLLKELTSVPIIVGGSGFSLFPKEVLKYLELETGIISEGEKAFLQIIQSLEKREDYSHIPNTCHMRNGYYYQNPVSYSELDYVPDRDLLNNSRYQKDGGMANIQTKRGCPFKCIYCTYPALEGCQLRLRQAEEIVSELIQMKYKYSIDYVFFVDDIFNIPLEHAVSICEEIIRKEVGIKWSCFATPLGMTQELAALMKRAGCSGVEFGSDTGSEKILQGLNKSFSTHDIAHAAHACNYAKLPHAHYILIGGPGEDILTLKESFNFFEKINPSAVIALPGIRIYPHTRLYNKAIEEQMINKNSSLLNPVFYITPFIKNTQLIITLSEHASKQQNWIVPALNLRCDSKILNLLRKSGKRGPLWNILAPHD